MLVQQVVPALRITDYARSKACYVDGLGFHIDWEHRFEPHFPVFMQVTRDGLTFYLSEHAGIARLGGWSIFTSRTSMIGMPSCSARGSR